MPGEIAQQLEAWWAPALAFAAGIVSFASPCVLPLVPGYLSFVAGGVGAARSAVAVGGGSGAGSAGTGTAVSTRSAAHPERPAILPILLFIAGFTIVFTLVGGFTASALRRLLLSPPGQRVAGVIVVLFGILMILYAVRARLPWLYREGRPLLSRVRPGPAGALPLGMAFAVGWTPCIGPVLGAILTLAAGQPSGRAVLLLLAYSLGLGVPFLLLGLGVRRLMGTARFFSRNYHWFAGIGGSALVLIGVLVMSGAWTRLVAPLFRFGSRIGLPI